MVLDVRASDSAVRQKTECLACELLLQFRAGLSAICFICSSYPIVLSRVLSMLHMLYKAVLRRHEPLRRLAVRTSMVRIRRPLEAG